MKAVLIRCMFFTLASVAAWAQKIETLSPDPNQIIHVKTAMNHLTVIELGQPVTAVAAGSPAFKIEWRENKVFVQPTEAKLATNLFIWTASGRMNYELEPAGSVEQMDFIIGQPGSGSLSAPTAPKSKIATTGKPQVIQTAALLGGKPVRMDSFKEPKNRVIVLLKDIFQQENQLFIRYAIRNDGKESYEPGRPQVFTLSVPYSADLHHLVNYQLTDKEARQLKGADQNPVKVLDMQLRSPHIVPGEETVGVVGMNLPAAESHGPRVLRLMFPADGHTKVEATLVL